MFCGTQFWNRMLNDAGAGGFLSLGWNLCFAREFGGSLLSPCAKAYDRASGNGASATRDCDAQNKTPFILVNTGLAKLLAGLITYFLTGDKRGQPRDRIIHNLVR